MGINKEVCFGSLVKSRTEEKGEAKTSGGRCRKPLSRKPDNLYREKREFVERKPEKRYICVFQKSQCASSDERERARKRDFHQEKEKNNKKSEVPER